jgi:hypothetical protein
MRCRSRRNQTKNISERIVCVEVSFHGGRTSRCSYTLVVKQCASRIFSPRPHLLTPTAHCKRTLGLRSTSANLPAATQPRSLPLSRPLSPLPILDSFSLDASASPPPRSLGQNSHLYTASLSSAKLAHPAYLLRTIIPFWDARAPWSHPSSKSQHVSQTLTCRKAENVASRRMADSAGRMMRSPRH